MAAGASPVGLGANNNHAPEGPNQGNSGAPVGQDDETSVNADDKTLPLLPQDLQNANKELEEASKFFIVIGY